MLDAWKDCEVLNTHGGRLFAEVIRGHEHAHFPRTASRRRCAARRREHAQRGRLSARLNTRQGRIYCHAEGQVYCHLEQVRRGRQQGGDGPLNTHEHAR